MLEGTLINIAGGFAGWFIGWVGWSLWDKWRREKKAKLEEDSSETQPQSTLAALIGAHESHSAMPKLRMGVVEAINGRILEVMTAIPHSGMATHYDWKTELYVIPEGQKLSEAIATVMLMKGLEK